MQDRALAEAIVAGDPEGIAEAYDRYAGSLYAYCCAVLPGPEAAEAVLDTFLIAVARLDELRDPDRLDAWLHAVARNECLRLLELQAWDYMAAAPGAADPDDELPAVTLPADLEGKVLAACTDNTPAGRAQRMSVAHRAGSFGPTGFPKAAGASGAPWWQRGRRHHWVTVAAVALAATALATGVTVVMTAGGPHRPQASGPGLGGGAAAGSASSMAPGQAGTAPTQARKASPSPSRPAAPVSRPAGIPSLGPVIGQGTPEPSPSFSSPPTPTPVRPSAPPPPPPSPPPSRSPSPPPPPTQGHLVVTPDRLQLTAAKGDTASGVFVLTAVNGPVSKYTISTSGGAAGTVTASPSAGSLPAGGSVTVTVTVTSKTPVNADVIVEPGNLAVQVMFKVAKN